MKKIAFKPIYRIIFALLIFVFIFKVPAQEPTTYEKLKMHVQYLASDSLEGRYPSTEGNKKAAAYMEDNFKKAGLLPVNNSFRQTFQFPAALDNGKNCDVTFKILIERPGVPKEMWKPMDKKWKAGTDFQPMSFAENTKASGELAFAGYGITAKDLEYDDYANFDVKGKIVIILTGSPDAEKKKNDFEDFESLNYKADNAKTHGAAGIIFVKPQGDSCNVFFPLKPEKNKSKYDFPIIQANRTSLSFFFPKKEQLLPLEQEINKKRQPKSIVIPNTSVVLNTELVEMLVPVDNIIGYVKGTDPSKANEYVVVGAHFDHLGVGYTYVKYRGNIKHIYNGADDNASGSSILSELAARVAAKPFKRSVLFIAFNSEEEGLLGSKFYVKNPLVPLENSIAMLNLDMIGRLEDNKLNVFGLSTSNYFGRMLDSLAVLDTISIAKIDEGFGPSDHSAFVGSKIPSLHFFTGATEDYHKPTDKWNKLNFTGMVKTTKYVESVLRTLANNDFKPDCQIKMTDNHESKGERSVWFGIIPDFEQNADGMKIKGTSDGSPAQTAGLENGDILKKINEMPIKNIGDLNNALKSFSPGETVKVTILRSGAEKQLDVVLKARKK
jgi:aminopeptidase YwaD